jgi:hypothetical protein
VVAEYTEKSADTKMANLGGKFKIIRNVIFVTSAVLPGNYIQSHELKLDAGNKNSRKTHNCTTKKQAA